MSAIRLDDEPRILPPDPSEDLVSEETQSDWPTRADAYELLQVIGIGDVAKVNQAYCIPRNEYCAVKRISLMRAGDVEMELPDGVLKHIEKITSVYHENISSSYTSFIVDNELWLVLKLLEGGSLHDLIEHKMRNYNCSQGVFDEIIISTILKSLLLGLEYLHSQGLTHGNVKSGNILICEDGTIQIGDYGVNSLMYHIREKPANVFVTKQEYKYIGSAWWIAPEVLKMGHHEWQADIWSVGITAIEMVQGHPPYYKCHPMKVLMLTMLNDSPTIRTGITDKNQYTNYRKVFHDMIKACLQKDPEDRPTATKLLQHNFMRTAKDKKYLCEKLVPLCPSFEARSMEVAKRRASCHGRLHRTFAGEWQWGEDEDEREAREKFRPCLCADSEQLLMLSYSNESNKTQISHASVSWKASIHKRAVIKLALKIRNNWKKLTQISFDYKVGTDTPESIGDALVNAGLVDSRDGPAVTVSLQKLFALRMGDDTVKSTVFVLNSAGHNEMFDDKALVGFAELNIL